MSKSQENTRRRHLQLLLSCVAARLPTASPATVQHVAPEATRLLGSAPVAWFAAVEAQFQLRQVTSQSERFCHLTAALDKASLKKVVHIVTAPDPLQPYTILKEALLTSHHMTDFQRV